MCFINKKFSKPIIHILIGLILFSIIFIIYINHNDYKNNNELKTTNSLYSSSSTSNIKEKVTTKNEKQTSIQLSSSKTTTKRKNTTTSTKKNNITTSSKNKNYSKTTTTTIKTTNTATNATNSCISKKFYIQFRADFESMSKCDELGKQYMKHGYGYDYSHTEDDCGVTYYMLVLFDEDEYYYDYRDVQYLNWYFFYEIK